MQSSCSARMQRAAGIGSPVLRVTAQQPDKAVQTPEDGRADITLQSAYTHHSRSHRQASASHPLCAWSKAACRAIAVYQPIRACLAIAIWMVVGGGAGALSLFFLDTKMRQRAPSAAACLHCQLFFFSCNDRCAVLLRLNIPRWHRSGALPPYPDCISLPAGKQGSTWHANQPAWCSISWLITARRLLGESN